MTAQRMAILACLLLAACGERAATNDSAQGSTTPPYIRAETENSLLSSMVQPVRIGELGPNFAACNARGATRDRNPAAPIPVRAAPYEESEPIAGLGPDAQFFICSRTNDQRWFGIVYDEGGEASERCGVSAPVSGRRIYRGPCAAGWVASASVRLVSGVPHQLPVEAAQPAEPPNG
jgi:hypothetical protein